MTRLLILLAMPEKVRARYFDRLKSAFPQIAVDAVDHHSKVDPYIDKAEVLLTFAPMLSPRVIQEAKSPKWIQALGTGVDGIADHPALQRDTIVTRIHGIHEAAVSEAAISSMLALARDLPRAVRNQDKHVWERWPSRLLDRKTAAIYGVGSIAMGLAPRLKALGMRVIGISSKKREVAGFERIYGRDELVAAVRECDFLVILTPTTPETHHTVNARVLAAMKPGSYLVNVAHGGVVDEDALLEALDGNRLAGAAMDVFAKEPLPADHPLWNAKNFMLTPHLGGFYDEYPDRALPVVEENMRRFLAGDFAHMVNRVEH
ncbi:MAG: D-2-hydroxyacid dehydrogenase [Stellaceae bacterium]